MSTRAEALRTMAPQLIADLTLYPTSEGGKKLTIHPGHGCPCLVSKAEPLVGYDGWPLLEEPLRVREAAVFLGVSPADGVSLG
jgi:hypothetical protein